jgi:hypothetical protein
MTSFPDTSEVSDLTISDLNNCIVNLLPDASGGHSSRDSSLKISALHIRNLTDTVLLLPIIQGSVLLHDLRRCVVVAGCHQVRFLSYKRSTELKTRQFRMHNSTSVDVYLSISSTPIIEHCSQIRFASYPASLRISEDSSVRCLIYLMFAQAECSIAQCPLHPRFFSHQIHTLAQLVDAAIGDADFEVANR